MKVLVKDGEKEVMYVQIHNFYELRNRNITLPVSQDRIKDILSNMHLHYDKEFVPFDDPREVNLFKAYDFIMTYAEVKQYTKEELEELVAKLKRVIAGVNERLKDLKEYNRVKNNKIFKLRYETLYIKLARYEELLFEKRLNDDLELAESVAKLKR